MTLPVVIYALLLANPFVSAQRFRHSQDGCLLDQAEDIIANIGCGRRSTVTFAIEWYGASEQELHSWLGLAGCSDDEARDEARRAARRCRVQTATEPILELRREPKDTQRFRSKRKIQLDSRIGIPEDDRRIKSDDTAVPTTTPTDSMSSSASWVLVATTSGVETTKTCATERSFTQTSCTSSILAGKMSKSCAAVPTETMSCLPGFSCAFATDTGDFSCYEKQGVPLYGWIIAGVFALAALFAVIAIIIKFCRQRRKERRQIALREEMYLMPMQSTKTTGVVVREFGVSATTMSSNISDTVPLMVSEYPMDSSPPRSTHHSQTPGRIVENCLKAGDEGSRDAQGSYAPFSDHR